jgi:anti-sigma B factor antagonist/stage II sporulation protein AA (anti-sigma F factor antagonist)
MDLSPRRFADTLVLAPTGRIDHQNAEAFRVALTPHLVACTPDKDRLVVDLSRLDYISSAGLRVFMLAARQTKTQQGTLVLAGLQPLIGEIFSIARFDLVLQMFPSLREALARVSPAALAAFGGA